MSKKFQIPATAKDIKLFHSAARKSGLSGAEWARKLLRKEAQDSLLEKSWDRLFTDLEAISDTDDWVAPHRTPAKDKGGWE